MIDPFANTGWIYRMFWPGTRYYYVGQTVDYKRRQREHMFYFRNNSHYNIRLQRLYNKYGQPKFKKLISMPNELLDETERYYIKLNYHPIFCCNILMNATSLKGFKHSEETKKQLSLKHTGKTLTADHKEQIRLSMLKVNFDRNQLRKQFTGSSNPKAKIVLDLETGIFYDTLVEAAKAKGINYKSLSRSINRNKIKWPTLIYA